MNGHLGSLISALVDDQLPPHVRERALAHAAACSSCAQEIQATRRAHGLLANPGCDPVARHDFVSGLMSLAQAERSAFAQSSGGVPADFATQYADNPFIVRESIPRCAFSGEVRRRLPLGQMGKYAAVFALGGACALAFVLGSRPLVTPAVDDNSLHAKLASITYDPSFSPVIGVASDADPGQVDNAKLVKWLHQHSWAAPSALPDSVSVAQVGFSASNPSQLEIVLSTPYGSALITERRGALDAAAISQASVIEHDGGPVYVLGDSPTHLVWQNGEIVMELVSAQSISQLAAVTQTMDVDRYDESLGARLMRGFTDIAGVVRE